MYAYDFDGAVESRLYSQGIYDSEGVELVSFDSLATEANRIAREAVSLTELAELGGEGVTGIFREEQADELEGVYNDAL